MSKTLVAYFSASGVTAGVAQRLSEAAGADIFEIKPAVPYTAADLDWHDKSSRSSVEKDDKNARPEISDMNVDISEYDKIFLGFPIWWYTAPRIISSFLEGADFGGKKIILFATSGGSGLGGTASDLKEVCPSADIVNGRILSRSVSDEELKSWAQSV